MGIIAVIISETVIRSFGAFVVVLKTLIVVFPSGGIVHRLLAFRGIKVGSINCFSPFIGSLMGSLALRKDRPAECIVGYRRYGTHHPPTRGRRRGSIGSIQSCSNPRRLSRQISDTHFL